jgi:hypothetical protein
MTQELAKDIDYQTCEQMRQQGIPELEIECHVTYYDEAGELK